MSITYSFSNYISTAFLQHASSNTPFGHMVSDVGRLNLLFIFLFLFGSPELSKGKGQLFSAFSNRPDCSKRHGHVGAYVYLFSV